MPPSWSPFGLPCRCPPPLAALREPQPHEHGFPMKDLILEINLVDKGGEVLEARVLRLAILAERDH